MSPPSSPHVFTLEPEYVAPLGSTSLIFNFLFARFLIGTPVTMTDIYVRTFYRSVTSITFFPVPNGETVT